MTALEERVFAAGCPVELLMEKVGRAMAARIIECAPVTRGVVIFIGRTHNGGDGLVAARALAEAGFAVEVRFAHPPAKLAPLTARMAERLPAHVTRSMIGEGDYTKPGCRPARVVLDAILGVNARGALRIPERAACREMNALRRASACIIALDLPSGLDADTGALDPDAVLAGRTLTVGFAKRGLMVDAAVNHVGRLDVIALPEFSRALRESGIETSGHDRLSDPESLIGLIPPRAFDSHKGHYGRVGIFAGSVGFTGAARLSALGALRGGAGLVTVFARRHEVYPIIAAAAPPEAMVKPIDDPRQILDERIDILAIGPGLGLADGEAVRQVIEQFPRTAVVDADAINVFVRGPSGAARLDHCAGARLLTPHPGEMARLFPESLKLSRAETARNFSDRYPDTTLLLKGARTIVARRGLPLAYNVNGTPGMATGGMGDVLTGVCAALLAQGLTPYDAARVAAWLCAAAAEDGIADGESEQSLAASDIPRRLGRAFRRLNEGM